MKQLSKRGRAYNENERIARRWNLKAIFPTVEKSSSQAGDVCIYV